MAGLPGAGPPGGSAGHRHSGVVLAAARRQSFGELGAGSDVGLLAAACLLWAAGQLKVRRDG